MIIHKSKELGLTFIQEKNFDRYRYSKACRVSRPDFEKPMGRVTDEFDWDGDGTQKVGS